MSRPGNTPTRIHRWPNAFWVHAFNRWCGGWRISATTFMRITCMISTIAIGSSANWSLLHARGGAHPADGAPRRHVQGTRRARLRAHLDPTRGARGVRGLRTSRHGASPSGHGGSCRSRQSTEVAARGPRRVGMTRPARRLGGRGRDTGGWTTRMKESGGPTGHRRRRAT